MTTRELNKNLKFTYLNWIKNEIEDDIKNYYSITLHLNPFNKFFIQPYSKPYKDNRNGERSTSNIDYDFWRRHFKDGSYVEWGGREKYSKCMKKFIHKLSDKIWGNNWNRRGQGFEFVIGFFEDGMNRQDQRTVFNKSLKNPHYHLVIKKPDCISELKFRSMIINMWGFWKFKFNKKYKNRSGELSFEGDNGEWRVNKIGGVFDHINIKKFYRKESGYDFGDYGMKKFNEYDHKVDLRNFIMKGKK